MGLPARRDGIDGVLAVVAVAAVVALSIFANAKRRVGRRVVQIRSTADRDDVTSPAEETLTEASQAPDPSR
jgi:hypothetical protein